jgi:hypothetical protein
MVGDWRVSVVAQSVSRVLLVVEGGAGVVWRWGCRLRKRAVAHQQCWRWGCGAAAGAGAVGGRTQQ